MSNNQDKSLEESVHSSSFVTEARREIHLSGWVIFINCLFLIAVVVIAFRWADWNSFLSAISHINLFLIVVVVVLQSGTYVCMAYAWHSVLRRFVTSIRIPIHSLLSLSVAKLFLDQAVPTFGLGGTALAIRGLLRRGSQAHVAVAAAAVYTLADTALNVLFFVVAFLILSANHSISSLFSIPNVLLIVAVTTAILLALAYAIRNTHFLKSIKNLKLITWFTQMVSDIPRHTLTDFSLWTLVLSVLAGIWVLDAGTLWVLLLALGTSAPMLAILACSVMASVVSNIIIIPGGIGTYESSSITLLHLFGIPLEQAIAASILTRGFTYWLPMIPGFLIARREMIGVHKN